MNFCNTCNAVVETKASTYHVTGRNIPAYGYDDNDERCPNCNNDDIGKAGQCEVCKEWFSVESGDLICDKRICKHCVEKHYTQERGIKFLIELGLLKEFVTDDIDSFGEWLLNEVKQGDNHE